MCGWTCGSSASTTSLALFAPQPPKKASPSLTSVVRLIMRGFLRVSEVESKFHQIRRVLRLSQEFMRGCPSHFLHRGLVRGSLKPQGHEDPPFGPPSPFSAAPFDPFQRGDPEISAQLPGFRLRFAPNLPYHPPCSGCDRSSGDDGDQDEIDRFGHRSHSPSNKFSK